VKLNWVELEEFPDYAVSDEGDLVNIKTGAPRKLSINQQGIPKISLYNKEGRLVTRSVALIVAEAFVPRPDEEVFDTPIHLDGERMNCRADNLLWRPRWFAIKYHKQFRLPEFHASDCMLMELDSKAVYPSIKEACIHNGLYWFDVVKSFTEETFVFPTWQEFRLVTE
jgi:hypothetical protein